MYIKPFLWNLEKSWQRIELFDKSLVFSIAVEHMEQNINIKFLYGTKTSVIFTQFVEFPLHFFFGICLDD